MLRPVICVLIGGGLVAFLLVAFILGYAIDRSLGVSPPSHGGATTVVRVVPDAVE